MHLPKHNLLFGAALICLSLSTATSATAQRMRYPDSRPGTHTDEYFGTKVPDPYRWMENSEDPEVRKWIVAQNELTNSYLRDFPQRAELVRRITELWNYEKVGAPFVEGNYLYYFKNSGLQNQSVLYRRPANSATAQEELFLDPNKFSTDGTISLSGIEFSKDGSIAAYQTSDGGSDWTTMYVMRADGTKMKDVLTNVKFSGVAWKGNEGFYYSTYDKPESGAQLTAMTDQHKLMYHKLGTPQSADVLVFGGSATSRRYIGAYTSEDEHYLFITAANATYGNELYLLDLKAKNAAPVPIATGFNYEQEVVYAKDDQLFILTNLGAPNRKLVRIQASKPALNDAATIVIPEGKFPLSVSQAGGRLFAQYVQDAVSNVKVYTPEGKVLAEVKLPGLGSAGGFSGKSDQKTTYYTYTSYTNPTEVYALDLSSLTSTIWARPTLRFKPEDYESRQVFYMSKDGTRIPMILSYRKLNNKSDTGPRPTLLYGYGGFSVSLTPGFSPSTLAFLEAGGVYAVANLRGGGEYGDAWHNAGTKMQKQNVFDDFAAAADYLVKEGITTRKMLGISGGSNGGLLVGATITQRPDICQVAFPAVGVLDMLRYNAFTAGAGWAYDYGTAQDNPDMFRYLLGYSPLHNTKKGSCYPATLVTTGDHDDRVVPSHSFKFAAALQAAQGCDNPVLIRIETRAGHGAGRPTAMVIEEAADKWAFFFKNIGVPYRPAR